MRPPVRQAESCQQRIDLRSVRLLPVEQQRTWMGYRRPDGRVGTRNYVAVIASVTVVELVPPGPVAARVTPRTAPESATMWLIRSAG